MEMQRIWITGLNVRANTIKLLLEKLAENLSDPPFDKYFLNRTQKTSYKRKKKKNFIKINLICFSKALLQKQKGKPQTGIKYLQAISPTHNLNLEYTKHSN